MRKAGLVAGVVLLWLASGCKRNIDTPEAVRQGVISHLAGRAGLDIGSMDVEVASVAFRGDEAEAVVSFRPKGSTDPASMMQMQYTLERQGGRWVVRTKKGAGGGAHETLGLPGDPHQGQTEPSGSLPQGHPPVGEAVPSPARP